VGPFEEEEEGTGASSHVFKVEGENPRLSKGGQGEVGTSAISDRGSGPYIAIPQYGFNKTK